MDNTYTQSRHMTYSAKSNPHQGLNNASGKTALNFFKIFLLIY